MIVPALIFGALLACIRFTDQQWRTHLSGTLPNCRRFLISSATLVLLTGPVSVVLPREGDLLGRLPFATLAPQDIAFDPENGTYWITAFLGGSIHHYSSDLKQELESFPSPFGLNGFPTGITFNTIDGTLLVTSALAGTIVEVAKSDGAPTGREIRPAFLPGRDGSVDT